MTFKTALVEPPTVKVADLTGPGTSSAKVGVGGTDPGIAVTLADGRTGSSSVTRSPIPASVAGEPKALFPPGTAVGEMSLGRVERHWASARRIRVKVLDAPTDDMAKAPTTTVLRNTAWKTSPRCSTLDGRTAGTLSQRYGGYIVPGSTLRRLHLVVSH